MTILRGIILLLQFTIVPIAIGRLITYKAQSSLQKDFIVTYLLGFFANLAVFYVLNSIFVWYQNSTIQVEAVAGSFTRLVKTYSIITFVIVLLRLVLEVKKKSDLKKVITEKLNEFIATIKSDKLVLVYVVLFAGLLVMQLYAGFFYEVNEWSYDDYDYVVTSKDDISYDMISNVNMITGVAPNTSDKRAATAWPTYVAYLAYTSGFEVTTVAHSILPVLLLLVAYITYYFMARTLFDKADNRLIFLILLSFVFIFGLFSHYSLTFRLLCTLWQGKAVLSAIAVPFIACYMAKALLSEWDLNIVFTLIFTSLGICSLTTMSMLLYSMTVIICFITMCICSRKFYGVSYLLAGLSGPVLQLIFYLLVVMLLKRQVNPEVFGDFWFW